MNNYNSKDLEVLFGIISNLFDANNPSHAYSLMGIYDSSAEALGLPSWHHASKQA